MTIKIQPKYQRQYLYNLYYITFVILDRVTNVRRFHRGRFAITAEGLDALPPPTASRKSRQTWVTIEHDSVRSAPGSAGIWSATGREFQQRGTRRSGRRVVQMNCGPAHPILCVYLRRLDELGTILHFRFRKSDTTSSVASWKGLQMNEAYWRGVGNVGLSRFGHRLRTRLAPSQGERPGRPSDPTWTVQRKLSMSEKTLETLERLADVLSTVDRRVSPMQVAALLIEDAAKSVADREP